MSKASILRQLSDEDLEAIHHLIRRDAMPDGAIAAEAERRGQTPDAGRRTPARKFSLGPTDAAKAMTITRYRQSPQYKRWLSAWENRDADLRKAIETQKQRFELISNLVTTGDATGVETISKSLQARLLALAAEADDSTLKAAAGGKGWVSEVLKLAQADIRDQYRRKVEDLKAELQKLIEANKGRLSGAAMSAKVDEIMTAKITTARKKLFGKLPES